MSNMNGGVMKSQRARVGAGYQPPALPFAQLPNPDSVLGQVYIASNAGPAPGIELIAAPGRWRPRGGRQVLAMRGDNPVTIQNLAGDYADTIGPFPGGLVRAGMQLHVNSQFSHSGIGTGGRIHRVLIGNSIPIDGGVSSANIQGVQIFTSGSSLNASLDGWVNVVASGASSSHNSGTISVTPYATGQQKFSLQVDFSIPWYVQIQEISAAETAVNITSASWVAGIATFGTSAAHTLAVGDKTVIAGVTPSGYNVAAGAIVLSVPTTTQFTVAMAANPGAYTSGGTSSRISNMVSLSYVLTLVG